MNFFGTNVHGFHQCPFGCNTHLFLSAYQLGVHLIHAHSHSLDNKLLVKLGLPVNTIKKVLANMIAKKTDGLSHMTLLCEFLGTQVLYEEFGWHPHTIYDIKQGIHTHKDFDPAMQKLFEEILTQTMEEFCHKLNIVKSKR